MWNEDGDPFCFSCGTLAFRTKHTDFTDNYEQVSDFEAKPASTEYRTVRHVSYSQIARLHTAPQQWCMQEVARMLGVSEQFVMKAYIYLGMKPWPRDSYLKRSWGE